MTLPRIPLGLIHLFMHVVSPYQRRKAPVATLSATQGDNKLIVRAFIYFGAGTTHREIGPATQGHPGQHVKLVHGFAHLKLTVLASVATQFLEASRA